MHWYSDHDKKHQKNPKYFWGHNPETTKPNSIFPIFPILLVSSTTWFELPLAGIMPSGSKSCFWKQDARTRSSSSRICWSPDILHVLPVLFHSSAWEWYAFFTTDLGAATAHISDKKPLRTTWLTSSPGMSYGLMSMSSAKIGCFGRLKQIQQYRRTLSSFAHSSVMGVPPATFPCRSRLSSWLTRSLCWFCKLPCLSVLRMILLLQLSVLCIFSCLSVPMPSPVCVSLCRWS